MSITHIVAFTIPSTVSAAEVTDLCKGFMDLQNLVVKPDGTNVVKSIKGGKNNSTEGLAKGHTHCFVVEFENAEDRDYYAHVDPKHKAFAGRLVGMLEGGVNGVVVVDFEEGVY